MVTLLFFLQKIKVDSMEEVIVNCSTCDAIFNDEQSLNEHTNTHLTKCSSKCSVCEESYDNDISLIKQKNKHLGKNSDNQSIHHQTAQFIEIILENNSFFVCFVCFETFNDKGCLNTHILLHDEKYVRNGATHELYDTEAFNETLSSAEQREKKEKSENENVGCRLVLLLYSIIF